MSEAEESYELRKTDLVAYGVEEATVAVDLDQHR
jgi:hypothetical protein